MKEPNKRPSFELITSLIAIVLGCLALYFSWQANAIAERANTFMEEQNKGRLVSLAGHFVGFSTTDPYHCYYSLSVGNIGLAPIIIKTFSAIVSYRDISLEVDTPTIHGNFRKDSTVKPITQYSSWLTQLNYADYTNDPASTPEEYKFKTPFTIESGQVIDVEGHIVLTYESSLPPGYYITVNVPNYEEYYKTKPDGYSPVEISYRFYTHDNDYVETKKLPCIYLNT